MSALPPIGTAEVVKADSRNLPYADDSVDLIVTSPPYFALRSYQDGGEHYTGQVGEEATPAEFVASLIEVTRECVRVLKPAGSLWVNLGDKYARSGGVDRKARSEPGSGDVGNRKADRQVQRGVDGVREKSLIGIPWRYAIACIDDLGLILRAEVIWSKPNGLPESVTDRVRRSHEQWFHFTLQPRYFSAVDEIREQAEADRAQAVRAAALAAERGIGEAHRQALLSRGLGDQGRSAATQSGTGKNTAEVLRLCAEADEALGSYTREFTMTSQALGKLPGSVWTIPTEPLKVPAELGIDHFAAFPTEWPRRIINGFSPAGICDECGEGRRPVTKTQRTKDGEPVDLGGWKRGGVQEVTEGVGNWRFGTDRSITGYACACGTDPEWGTHPAVVLDPFGGTGTTAMVAKALGRHGITVDMSADYCRLAEWRTNDEAQIERVQNMQVYGVRKPTKTQVREYEARVTGALSVAGATVSDTPPRELQ